MPKGRKTKVVIAEVTYGDCSFRELTFEMIQLLSFNHYTLSRSGVTSSIADQTSKNPTCSDEVRSRHASPNEVEEP